jgi:hypothetical protein
VFLVAYTVDHEVLVRVPALLIEHAFFSVLTPLIELSTSPRTVRALMVSS